MTSKITSFRKEYRFLSNYSPCGVFYEGLPYPSVEHAYQAAKTETPAFKRAIQQAPTPNEAKQLGALVKLRPGWEQIKISIMRNLLLIKFSNNDLMAKLKSTYPAELVEGNYWHDNFWGACECIKCKHEIKENVLGELLMEIRDNENTKTILSN